MSTFRWILLGAIATSMAAPMHAYAATLTDFEATGFTVGDSVDNYLTDGTQAAPPITNGNQSPQAWFNIRARGATPPDEEIVDLTGSPNPVDQAHGKVWRLSQGVATGSLGAAIQSPHMGMVAGETGALNDAGRGPVTTNVFHGQFDFRSVTGAPQPDLAINVTGASFDQRHGYISIRDDGANGFDLLFYDTIGTAFVSTLIDLDLSYTEWHTIDIEVTFNDGLASGVYGDPDAVGNDVVRIFANGNLVHTGTSWESAYAAGQDHAESIDALQFSAAAIPSQLGNGLYFDNVLINNVAVSAVPEPGTLALAGLAGMFGTVVYLRRRWA